MTMSAEFLDGEEALFLFKHVEKKKEICNIKSQQNICDSEIVSKVNEIQHFEKRKIDRKCQFTKQFL